MSTSRRVVLDVTPAHRPAGEALAELLYDVLDPGLIADHDDLDEQQTIDLLGARDSPVSAAAGRVVTPASRSRA